MPQNEPAEANGESAPDRADRRIREGTEIVDQPGYFRMTGDRVIFFAADGEALSADGEARFVALENLNLQRIARTITDNPVPLPWSVTGTITEYRGANFLFVRRAVLKRRTQLPQGAL